jgi:hypothetical protein
MKADLDGIYVFKTNKVVALNVLKKYTRLDDLSQRPIRRVPYSDRKAFRPS